MAIAYQCLCAGSTAFVIYDDQSSDERREGVLIDRYSSYGCRRISTPGGGTRGTFSIIDDGEKKLQSYQMQMLIHLQREDPDEAMFV